MQLVGIGMCPLASSLLRAPQSFHSATHAGSVIACKPNRPRSARIPRIACRNDFSLSRGNVPGCSGASRERRGRGNRCFPCGVYCPRRTRILLSPHGGSI